MIDFLQSPYEFNQIGVVIHAESKKKHEIIFMKLTQSYVQLMKTKFCQIYRVIKENDSILFHNMLEKRG